MPKSLAEYEALTGEDALTEAERKLIAACRAGRPCRLEDGTLPPEGKPSKARTIRAELLRVLITGGTSACDLHDSGVVLIGGHVTGQLDLRHARGRGCCTLNSCRFDQGPLLEQAVLGMLSLQGAHLPGLFAQGIKVAGGVFLRQVTVNGTVDLNGAKIDGQLECDGASFSNPDGLALNAQRIRVAGDIFLRSSPASQFHVKGETSLSGAYIGGQLSCIGATFENLPGRCLNAQGIRVAGSVFLRNEGRLKFQAKGEVRLSEAEIGGQLECDGGTFENPRATALNAQSIRVRGDLFLRNDGEAGFRANGRVNLAGAEIGGQLACDGASFSNETRKGIAFTAQGMKVTAEFFWRGINWGQGILHMPSARVGDLVDDFASWPTSSPIYLNGFTYERIGGEAPIDARSRLEWLSRLDRFIGPFLPQPYTQLAKVLREMGHAAEARKVLMERDRILFDRAWADDVATYHAARNGDGRGDMGLIWLRMNLRRLWAAFARRIVGFGHAPERALFWGLGSIAFGSVLYFIAWKVGLMVPNSAVILTSAEWLEAMRLDARSTGVTWAARAEAATHYETFYSVLFATDVFVPLFNLGQETAWSVTTVNGWGIALRIFTFLYQIAGWAITAMGIAAVTGFVQKSSTD